MKLTLVILLSLLFSLVTNAQTNDTDASFYSWESKKTEMQKGYLFLKSGKRLDGNISLEGNANNITRITFEGKDKKIEFPINALSSYGMAGKSNTTLNSNNVSVNDTKDELFTWREMDELIGNKISNTKPRNGYLITQSNERLEGELQLKKTDGILSDIKIKTREKEI